MANFNLQYQNIKQRIDKYDKKIIDTNNEIEAQSSNENCDKEKMKLLKKKIERLETNKKKYKKKEIFIIDKKIRLLEAIKKNDFEIIKAPRNWYTNYNSPYHGVILKCLLCGEEKKATEYMFKTKNFVCEKCSESNILKQQRQSRKQKYEEYVETALAAYPKARLRKPIRGDYYEDIYFTCEHGTDFKICVSKLTPKKMEWCNCAYCIEERGGKKNPNRMQRNEGRSNYIKQSHLMYECIKKLILNSQKSGLKIISNQWTTENEYYDFECFICGKKIKYRGVIFTQVFSSESKYTKVKEKGGCCDECFTTYKNNRKLYDITLSDERIIEFIKNSCKDGRTMIQGV